MKPIFILLILLFFNFNKLSAHENIPQLFEENIEIAKIKAKTEHKGVFILYYADWCGFCQKIFNETLPDESVQKALKAGFACYKIQNSTDEGNDFKVKYDIRSLPTLLFFNENGELVQKQAGMQTKAKLFALLIKFMKSTTKKKHLENFHLLPLTLNLKV